MATGMDRRVFLAVAGSAALTACAADRDDPTAPSLPRADLLLSPPLRIVIDGPKTPLLMGTRIDIVGTLYDPANVRLPNTLIAVEDGLSGRTTTTRTDGYGRIRFSTAPLVARAAIVTFIVQGQRFPFSFQAVRRIGTRLAAESAQVRQVVYNNLGSRALRVTLIGPTGARRVLTILPRQATRLLADTAALLTRVTTFGGYLFDAGPLNAAGTLDAAGVLTLSGTGGEGPFRGKLYATSAADLAAGWAPGASGPAGSLVAVNGGVDVCLGTTGFRLGAPSGPRTPNVLGDFSIQVG